MQRPPRTQYGLQLPLHLARFKLSGSALARSEVPTLQCDITNLACSPLHTAYNMCCNIGAQALSFTELHVVGVDKGGLHNLTNDL